MWKTMRKTFALHNPTRGGSIPKPAVTHRGEAAPSVPMSLVDWLLPLALPWTLSSSLRFPGVDAGPGEILLAAWMFSVWAQIVLHFNNYSQLRTPDAAVVKFWIASVPILLFSTVFSALH